MSFFGYEISDFSGYLTFLGIFCSQIRPIITPVCRTTVTEMRLSMTIVHGFVMNASMILRHESLRVKQGSI